MSNIDFEKYKEIFSHIIGKDDVSEDEILLVEEAVKSMVFYSGSVIVGRALPDLRDGLKPSQRRLLYTMKTLGISFSGSYKKSARITGSTIGLFHPHGDIAAYDTLVGMTQNWKLNRPLIDGQGNFGSIDGDSPASQRYTESRMTQFGASLFKDIDKNTVNFRPNYDGQELEPEVLPAPYPNIIINGVLKGSIAVGLASSIMPHNPNEVMDAMDLILKRRMKNQHATPEEILELIPAPDFPTGGYIYNTDNMLDIIKTGRGSVKVRAKHTIEDMKRGKKAIIITEIPWMLKKTNLIQQIVDLRKNITKENQVLSNITNIMDNSAENIRIVLELKSGTDPDVVWNYLLKNTDLDTSISSFAVVIDKEENLHEEESPTPKEYGLLTIMERYLEHRFEVVRRKYEFILKEAQERNHIVEGLLRAISMLDTIISIIRGSESEEIARLAIRDLGFSRLQTKAILNIRLAKLVALEKITLEKEKEELLKTIENAKGIVSDEKKQGREIAKEFKEIRKIISRERLSEIKTDISEIVLEDFIQKEDCKVVLTNRGYVKRITDKDYSRISRSGKPIIDLHDEDFVTEVFDSNTLANIVFVMASGQVYGIKSFDIPDSSTGTFMSNLFDIDPKDSLVKVLEVQDFDDKNILTILTSNGMIKKSQLDLYKGALRKPGILGINLKDESKVLNAAITENCEGDQSDVIIFTAQGKSIRFNLEQVSCVGRASQGVVAIKTKKGDHVVDMVVVKDDYQLIGAFTEAGSGKIMRTSFFKQQGRAGVGVICIGLTKKSGLISTINTWNSNEKGSLLLLTEKEVIFEEELQNMIQNEKNIRGTQIVTVPEGSVIIESTKKA